MTPKFSVTEPHPSVPKTGSAFLSGGRGGAGNYARYNPEALTPGSQATGPASRITLPGGKRSPAAMPTGRGGAGNMFARPDAELRLFEFDEEMLARRRREAHPAAPVYHIGRGGAANWSSSTTTTGGEEDGQHHRTSSSSSDDDDPRAVRMGSTASDTSVGSSSSETSAASRDGSEGQVRRSVQGALGRIASKFSS